MHLIIPYAASHTLLGPEVWTDLKLPNLQALLSLMPRQQVLQDPAAMPLHLPHERLLAQSLGWSPEAANLPWAAWHQAQQGQPSAAPQAWMTPCHWQIGLDQVVMNDPAHLQLSDEESQQLLQAMQPFLQEDGLHVTWRSALQWHAQGELLADLPTPSLDRVIGQNVKDWMLNHPAARPLQRLQSEMQMLLYNHPVNDARDARRQHTVNAFWLHGAGTLPVNAPMAAAPTAMSTSAASSQAACILTALRSSALHGNAPAWREAWQQLDARALADLLQHVKATGEGQLSLCSEYLAHTYTAAPAPWHQRLTHLFNKPAPELALQALTTA